MTSLKVLQHWLLQDLTVSDVGGWDLNLHHRYNPQEGILYRGDGSNVFLRERPRLIFDLVTILQKSVFPFDGQFSVLL